MGREVGVNSQCPYIQILRLKDPQADFFSQKISDLMFAKLNLYANEVFRLFKILVFKFDLFLFSN